MDTNDPNNTRVTADELRDAIKRLAEVTNPGLTSVAPPTPEGLAIALQLMQVDAIRELTRVLDGIDSRLAGVCDDGPDFNSALRVREA